MKNIILEFLEVYKSLDELCKQILSSNRGISEYIDEMDHERAGRIQVPCWEADYKQLKKMRWIRNQLVHEINSFQENLIKVEDIEWLKTFRSRIMECTDPFSLLSQSRKTIRKTTGQEKNPENNYKTNEQSGYRNLLIGVIIMIGILIFTIAISFMCLNL